MSGTPIYDALMRERGPSVTVRAVDATGRVLGSGTGAAGEPVTVPIERRGVIAGFTITSTDGPSDGRYGSIDGDGRYARHWREVHPGDVWHWTIPDGDDDDEPFGW